MKKLSIIAVVAMLFAVLAASGAMAMTLSSTSFKDGFTIPVKHANIDPEDGWTWEGAENISPALKWDAVTGAKCYVVFMEDVWFADNKIRDMYHGGFIVPESVTSIDEAQSEIPEAIFDSGYSGPCPPTRPGVYTPKDINGKEIDAYGLHKYRFTVYACTKDYDGINDKMQDRKFKEAEEMLKNNGEESATIYGNFGQTSNGGSSSGGCNAGFGILALLCAAPMIFRKKQ